MPMQEIAYNVRLLTIAIYKHAISSDKSQYICMSIPHSVHAVHIP